MVSIRVCWCQSDRVCPLCCEIKGRFCLRTVVCGLVSIRVCWCQSDRVCPLCCEIKGRFCLRTVVCGLVSIRVCWCQSDRVCPLCCEIKGRFCPRTVVFWCQSESVGVNPIESVRFAVKLRIASVFELLYVGVNPSLSSWL